MDAARQALELARKTGDQEGIVFDEETIGAIHTQRGEYQLALEQFNRTLADLETHHSPMVQALVEDDLGNVYAALGDHENAFAEYKRSEQSANANANPSTELDALVDEGNLHLARREYELAAAVFSRALTLTVDKGVTEKRAKALRGVGAAEVGEGHVQSGLQKLLDSRDQAQSLHDDFTEREADLSLGDYYFARSEFPKAEEAYNQLRRLAAESRSASQLAVAWASLARVQQVSGDLTSARTSAENALTTIEDQRSQINPPDLRSRFFQSTRSYYDLDIQILMSLEHETNDPAFARLALAAAENSRARAITDLLSEQSINVKSKIPPELLARRGQALDSLHAAAYRRNRLPASAAKKDRDALDASVKEAKHSLDEVGGPDPGCQSPFQRTDPSCAADRRRDTEPAAGSERCITRVLAEREGKLSLGGHHRLSAQLSLTTCKTAGRTHSRLLVSLASWSKLPPGVPLEQRAQHQATASAEISRLSGELGELLLKPALSVLGRKNLVFVSDGSLRALPFGFLPAGSKQTLESRNTLSYLPSAGSLRWLRKGPYRSDAAQSLAVFADPVFSPNDPRFPAHASRRGASLSADATVTRAMRDTNATDLSRLVWSRREAQSITRNLPPANRWLALDSTPVARR